MEIQIAGWDSRIHVICLGVPSYLVKYSITWFVCLNHSIGTLSSTEASNIPSLTRSWFINWKKIYWCW